MGLTPYFFANFGSYTVNIKNVNINSIFSFGWVIQYLLSLIFVEIHILFLLNTAFHVHDVKKHDILLT